MKEKYKNIKILVIEDNPGDFVLISEYLKEVFLDCEIDQTKTCKEAILKKIENFDVVLLDLSLPDRSGVELVTTVLKAAKHTPVIVLTGYTDKNFAIKSIGLGTADYLLKDELKPDILHMSIIYAMERKKVFSQLELSEKRYRELFHLSPLPMYVFNKENFKFLDVNKAAISHYGYSKEEFLSMTVLDIRPEGEKERVYEIISKISSSNPAYKSSNVSGLFKHIKKNGEVIDVEISYNDLEYQSQNAILVLANDVTLKYQYIEAIEKQNAKLKEIAWIQSHVVRAPLARLMGLVNLLNSADDDQQRSELKEMLQHIIESTQELDNIIREISNKTEQINIDSFK
ncbi:PAS domain S-box protein [Belliella kenyensis]|uniref:PAS domain S-box protein n=1 Tax=Belliella kenyensis TaxID=1472724 RepID=A0ABV8EJH3_9BACT|nr:PAS domain S-box protein [Belliella kenyensis]MCH7403531.1 PAS domain S-box protein [Belliella kenyensis]MDN3604947.1 PAS domain S-box protein [Belliella kenyensis]